MKDKLKLLSPLVANLPDSSSISKAPALSLIWPIKLFFLKRLLRIVSRLHPLSKTSMVHHWRAPTLWSFLKRITLSSSPILDLSVRAQSRMLKAVFLWSIFQFRCSSLSFSESWLTLAVWHWELMRTFYTLLSLSTTVFSASFVTAQVFTTPASSINSVDVWALLL